MKTIRFKNIFNSVIPVVLLALLGLTSCSKDEEQLGPMRLFTPSGGLKITSGETDVKLTWNAALYSKNKEVSYTVEFSQDSLFNSVEGSLVTDTSGIVFTDEKLGVAEKYFARIKTNATATEAESKWGYTPAFSIKGIFAPIAPAAIKDKTILLKWSNVPNLTKIVLTPTAGNQIEVPLTAEDDGAQGKLIKGLTPLTNYLAEIFAGDKLKGNIKFKTNEPSLFTVIITPQDDLKAAIEAAENNDVIGLEQGVYTYDVDPLIISRKHLTLQSVSGTPSNTTILFKEFKLQGTGAGVKFSGLELDGNGTADYFINLVGFASDSEAATFTSITVDNSIVTNTKNCAIRGNRGSNNGHKIDFIRFNNSIFKNNGGSYTYLTLAKMEFNRVEFVNSTFFDIGRALIMWDTNLTVPAAPTFLIESCTLANFGSRNHTILDASSNVVNFRMQNSILVNLPKTTSGTSLLRSGTGSTLNVNNSNLFNLTDGASPALPAIFPAATALTDNKAVDLGWTLTTTDFKLPANSELRTAGKTGGAIGDPRWH